MKKEHLYIKVVNGTWYATNLKGTWLTAQQAANLIINGATYEFVE